MRPNQHNNNNNNKNRNRNRSRSRTGYSGHGGGSGGGGNGANKVFDSNGPDVKLRGTAQTIAEKYMQLGRDAHSSGDTVMAESYYQFADHYYRVWLAAQPAGQPIQFSRRMGGEDEYEDDAQDGASSDGDDENASAEGESNEASDSTSAPVAEANVQQAGENFQPRQNRSRDNTQNRDNNQSRDNQNRDNNGNGKERFQRRWPRRFDRNAEGAPQAEGETQGQDRVEPPQDRVERSEPVERVERQARVSETVDPGNWEAPSFLTRPTPVIADEGVVEAQPRPRVRRPARVAAPPTDEPVTE